MSSNPTHATVTANTSTDEPVLLVTHEQGITTFTLNQPLAFNALSEAMLDALQSAIDALDHSTRILVIQAEGKAFCAGHNLKEMRANPRKEYYDALFKRCSTMMLSLLDIPQVVIAQVQGLATAAGCQLVANCDLAIASDDSRFAVSGINLGLFCSTPSVALSRNLQRKKAFQMLMSGEFISAATAENWGLINKTVPAGELNTAVRELCDTIMAKPAIAVRTGKELFYRQLELPVADAYALAGEKMACNMMDADAAEGIDAFIEKRKPEWSRE